MRSRTASACWLVSVPCFRSERDEQQRLFLPGPNRCGSRYVSRYRRLSTRPRLSLGGGRHRRPSAPPPRPPGSDRGSPPDKAAAAPTGEPDWQSATERPPAVRPRSSARGNRSGPSLSAASGPRRPTVPPRRTAGRRPPDRATEIDIFGRQPRGRIERGHERFQHAPHLGVGPAAGKSEHALLARQLARPRQVNFGDLEQFDVRVGRASFGRPRFQEAGDQARAEPVGAADHGRQARRAAGHRSRGSKPRARSSTALRVMASSKPQAVQHAADHFHHAVFRTAGRGGHRHAHVLGNLLVAVNPRHFLEQVDFPRQIAAPTGRHKGHVACAGRHG